MMNPTGPGYMNQRQVGPETFGQGTLKVWTLRLRPRYPEGLAEGHLGSLRLKVPRKVIFGT